MTEAGAHVDVKVLVKLWVTQLEVISEEEDLQHIGAQASMQLVQRLILRVVHGERQLLATLRHLQIVTVEGGRQ